ncbi:UNVERIFIED_CONTAM: PTS sorbose transporter subunit IIC, partial [Bifidobacterium breve]
PDWLMGGLKLAGAVLPVVGIAILLHYLPVGKFVAFLIAGYLLAAYLKIPMMGIALFGLVCALIHFKQLKEKQAMMKNVTKTAIVAAEEITEGEIEDDEL